MTEPLTWLIARSIRREPFDNDTKAIGATLVHIAGEVAVIVGPVTVSWRDGDNAPALSFGGSGMAYGDEAKAQTWLEGQNEHDAGDMLKAVLAAVEALPVHPG